MKPALPHEWWNSKREETQTDWLYRWQVNYRDATHEEIMELRRQAAPCVEALLMTWHNIDKEAQYADRMLPESATQHNKIGTVRMACAELAQAITRTKALLSGTQEAALSARQAAYRAQAIC